MAIICRDIWCFMLALVYLEHLMGDMQYKSEFSIRVRGGTTPSHLQCFFCTPPLFNFFWSWTKIVFYFRKCKHFAYIVTICRDVRYFMLALVYLENLMGDIQYKMWFSIRVREGIPLPSEFFCMPPLFNCFSAVELKVCLLSENIKFFLKWMFILAPVS